MLSSDTMIKPVDSPDAFEARIILVEDDKMLRESVAEYLTLVGYDVISVDCGLKFYHTIAEQNFVAAVIDLGLPDIDGLQLAEYIRNNTTMRCIILTARGSVDERIAGYNFGADLYMVKPVDCRELSSALGRMLQRTILEHKPSHGKWSINCQRANLITPESGLLQLTTKEMSFLLSLAESSMEPVLRDTILTTLGYRTDEYANRALESLVRRLRRKIESVYGRAPILTHHGIGYSFSAQIEVI